MPANWSPCLQHDRRQYMSTNSCKSNTRSIKYGVPQGSILGPLLFLLYINDIQYVSQNIDLRLFADDTAIFLHHKDIDVLMQDGKVTMKEIMTWFETNKLSLSLSKSNFILFHGKQKNSQRQITNITIGQEAIPRTYSAKYIGLTLDENLSWDAHIDNVCNNLVKYFSIFHNIRDIITIHVARAIYFCIHSRVKYGIETYGSASEYKMAKLRILQNKLLKPLTKKDRRYSTNKLHIDLNILKVKHIYEMSVLTSVHGCVRGIPIDSFKNYYDFRGNTHNYSLRNNEDLSSNQVQSNMGANTTHSVGAKLWNNTPRFITDISEQTAFKEELIKLYGNMYNEET